MDCVRQVREQLNGSREVRRDEDGRDEDAGEEREEREEREEAGEERGAGEEREELEDAAWASDAVLDQRPKEDRAREEEGVEDEEGEDEEEGRQTRGLSAPKTVSKEGRDEHERTHIPFRCWCKACVRAGKGSWRIRKGLMKRSWRKEAMACRGSAWIITS